MSKSKEAQLEDVVKTIQALSTSDLLAGAEYMLYFANVEKKDNGQFKITDEIVEGMAEDLRSSLVSSKPEIVESLISAFKTVRILCLESDEAVKYVKEQADEMAKLAATKAFFTDRLKNEDKGGCRIL